MYKDMIKKWVGMLFVLAICVTFSVFDVDAKSTCTKSAAKKYYNVRIVRNGTDDKTDSITVKASNGKFYLKLVSYDSNLTKEQIAKDSTIPVINSTSPLVGGKSYKITNSQLRNYYDGDGALAVKIVAIFDSNTEDDKDAVCDGDDKYIRMITYSEQLDDDKSTTSYNVSGNTQGCIDLNNFIKSHSDYFDSKMLDISKSILPSCFNQKVTYNVSDDTIAILEKEIEKIYNNYKKYKKNTGDSGNFDVELQKLKTLSSDWIEIKKKNKANHLTISDNTDKTYKKLGSNSSSMLTCSTKNERVETKLFYINEEKNTIDYTIGDGSVGSKVKKDNVDVCTTVCREKVSISYGPPVAVVAGQCFTYEVEVKSNVECIAQVNYDVFPKFSDFEPCTIYGSCITSAGHELTGYNEQAGPTEDFDSCVNSCDGGKYSQSCINSCYSKVYEKSTDTKSTTKTSSADSDNTDIIGYALDTLNISNNSKVSKVKWNGSNRVTSYTLDSACPSASASVDEVYNWVNKNITGNYTSAGGTLTYQPKNGGCIWSRYGYAYFRTKQLAARTVCNAQGYNWISGRENCEFTSNPNADNYEYYDNCLASQGCYKGRMKSGYRCKNGYDISDSRCERVNYYGNYYNPENGFKRQNGCSESCKWKVKNNGTCKYVDREKAEKDYINSIKKIYEALDGCMSKAAATCNTSNSVSYTMSANTDTTTTNQSCTNGNYESNGNCIDKDQWYNQSKTKQTTGKVNNLDLAQNTIIKLNDGKCYQNKSEDNMYHGIITFPGAWINNKTGKVTYRKPASEEEKWYTSYTGNYCTPLIAKNVNANWWTWHYYNKTGSITKEFDQWESAGDIKNIVYNIFSKIKNFGKYNWNINTGCFYAINNYTGKPCDSSSSKCDTITDTEVPGPEHCTSSSCPKKDDQLKAENNSKVDNYSSKSITSSNLFPSTKTSSLTDKTVPAVKLSYGKKMADTNSSTRSEGYNWSVQATNLSVKNYPVTPSSLVKKIQAGNTYVDSEIDYEFKLTKEQISTIKNESKSSTSDKFYINYANNYVKLNNNADYKKTFQNYNLNTNDVDGISFYKSNYIRSHATKVYAPDGNALKCNNLKRNGSNYSCDMLTDYVKSDSELQSWLSKVNS